MNYFNHMAEFKDALLDYRKAFQTQLSLDKAQRNFSEIVTQKEVVREKARRAHEALSAGTPE